MNPASGTHTDAGVPPSTGMQLGRRGLVSLVGHAGEWRPKLWSQTAAQPRGEVPASPHDDEETLQGFSTFVNDLPRSVETASMPSPGVA